MTKTSLTAVALLVTGLSRVALAQPPPPPTIEYYHLDAVGSVRAVTNETGQVVRQHHYFPFGEEYLAQGGNDPRRFTGKERDVETGLDYFGARYYASRTGRFIGVDPALNVDTAILDPQRFNRYSYAVNRPLVMVDPDGREAGYIYLPNGQMRAPIAGLSPLTGKLFSGTAAVGGAVLAVKALPALFAAAQTCFLSSSCQSNVLNTIEGLAGGSGSSPTFASGTVFIKEFTTAAGVVEVGGLAVVNGTALTVEGLMVYRKGKGNEILSVGSAEMRQIFRKLQAEARTQGFTQLRVAAKRASGANPGKEIDMVFDLTKEHQ